MRDGAVVGVVLRGIGDRHELCSIWYRGPGEQLMATHHAAPIRPMRSGSFIGIVLRACLQSLPKITTQAIYCQ